MRGSVAGRVADGRLEMILDMRGRSLHKNTRKLVAREYVKFGLKRDYHGGGRVDEGPG